MKQRAIQPITSLLMLTMLSLALGACSSLWPAPSPQPAYFALQATATAPAASAASLQPRLLSAEAPVLVVQMLRAAPGFESARIVYTRQPHRLEYFAHNEWVDAPARMLAPLLVTALESSGGFRAVVLAPSAATSALQLDTQLLRLQQEFASPPSRVRITLRGQLIHTGSRQVLATRDFEHVASSASEDAPGGVAAAQVAVQAVLADMAAWCRQVAATQPR